LVRKEWEYDQKRWEKMEKVALNRRDPVAILKTGIRAKKRMKGKMGRGAESKMCVI